MPDRPAPEQPLKVETSKTEPWYQMFVSACGGWWSAMSGPVSIPLAVVALIIGGSPGIWLAILGYVAVWVFALSVINHSRSLERKLNAEIQKLTGRLDEREKRKAIKDALGTLLGLLDNRIVQHKHSEWYKYKDDVLTSDFDAYTKLIKQIEEYLEANISNAEAQYFKSTSDMKWTHVPDGAQIEIMVDTFRQYQGMQDLLTHRANHLRKIIEKQM